MNIGLDYDDTYTRDPKTWNLIIFLLRQAEHKVYLVTWRDDEYMGEVYEAFKGTEIDGFYPTSFQAKDRFMFSKGIMIDVWIDDSPSTILTSSEYYRGNTGTWE